MLIRLFVATTWLLLGAVATPTPQTQPNTGAPSPNGNAPAPNPNGNAPAPNPNGNAPAPRPNANAPAVTPAGAKTSPPTGTAPKNTPQSNAANPTLQKTAQKAAAIAAAFQPQQRPGKNVTSVAGGMANVMKGAAAAPPAASTSPVNFFVALNQQITSTFKNEAIKDWNVGWVIWCSTFGGLTVLWALVIFWRCVYRHRHPKVFFVNQFQPTDDW